MLKKNIILPSNRSTEYAQQYHCVIPGPIHVVLVFFNNTRISACVSENGVWDDIAPIEISCRDESALVVRLNLPVLIF